MPKRFNGTLERRTEYALDQLAKDEVDSNLKMAERDRYMSIAMSGQANIALVGVQDALSDVAKTLERLIEVTASNREVCGGVEESSKDLADLIRKNESEKPERSPKEWLSENRAKVLVTLLTGLGAAGAGAWQWLTGAGS